MIDVDPAAEVADFLLKIPFIASALRGKQRYVKIISVNLFIATQLYRGITDLK